MHATFSHPNHESLWIKGNKKHLRDSDDGSLWRYDPDCKGNVVQLKFVESNEEHFSKEMGSLIRFLKTNRNGWIISDTSKEIVIQCLLNYSQGCRNAHVHKEIISDFNTVETIRTNTILCLLFLLGGYKIYDTPPVEATNHTAVDQEYNRFYKAVKKIPSSVNRFVIKPYNQDEIMAIRFYDQNKTEYDDIGNIITGIEFAIVDSFSIGDYRQFLSQIKPSQKLTISKDNIPEKMWWCSYCQGREIKRGEVKWRD